MNNMVNEKEICFIICSNHSLYTQECIYYLDHLNVPEGYQAHVLTVQEAASMASGYNEGMCASDAKYKVYLHQDVFIVNPDFIQDILDIFRQDESIGMIGMVGTQRLADNGIMWEGSRCGGLYNWRITHTKESWLEETGFREVEVIDGFLMATQYDIPWREDLFDKWDFYDCSQSKEFARRGYKVVVPKMEKPWCLHDSGYINMKDYDEECRKFLAEYGQELTAWKDYTSNQATVIVVSHNRLNILQDTLEWLKTVEGVFNIIVVDNGSDDSTAEWLATQNYQYMLSEKGVRGLGAVWNTVLRKFECMEHIVLMEAGTYPATKSIVVMMEIMKSQHAGIVSPLTNTYPVASGITKEQLGILQENLREIPRGLPYRKTLYTNRNIYMIHRRLLDTNGYFREELRDPKNVLLDYGLRMIAGDRSQLICNQALAYSTFHTCTEVYEHVDLWEDADREVLKHIWGMNYFNLSPNWNLADRIKEDTHKEFHVLEIGCDLGATLFEIRQRYPRCKTYGLDINKEAVEIAKHIAQVRYGNIDELALPFDRKFDYIIFGDVLEHLRHPEEVITLCRDYLTEGGYIVASIPNLMHISVMERLINGVFPYQDTGLLDRTHIHFFTYYEIIRMFRDSGYEIEEIINCSQPVSAEQKELEKVLLGLSDYTQEWMYETIQYLLKVRKAG